MSRNVEGCLGRAADSEVEGGASWGLSIWGLSEPGSVTTNCNVLVLPSAAVAAYGQALYAAVDGNSHG